MDNARQQLVARPEFCPALTYLDARDAYVTSQLPASVPFVARDLQSGSHTITVNAPVVTLGGTAWINVHEIRVQGKPKLLGYLSDERHQLASHAASESGTHAVTFEAYDFQGKLVGTDTVTITSTVSPLPQNCAEFTELMYHPGNRNEAEIAAGFTNDDDFEFIEIKNAGPAPSIWPA